MKNLTFLVALFSCFWTSAIAQKKTKPTVSNIRAEADGKRLKVTYSLEGTAPTDSVYLQVESRTRGVLPLKTVSGGIGKGVEPGPNKIIYWDYEADGMQPGESDAVTVRIQSESVLPPPPPVTKLGGGPGYALLSVVLPGVGNIFVQPNRKIGLRPLVTVSYLGLLAYGLSQKSQSNKQYDLYNAQLNESDAQPYYDAANQYHQRYYLATRAAAVLMLTDVTFTLLRGIRNQRLQRTQPSNRLSLQYFGATPTLAFRRTF